jgi:NAD(P)-dependent dehydrogenase (short-subunit alcohol dehydrogenase family)
MSDQDDASLSGKVAIVTGASRGLGRATAMALVQHGADVALIARSGAGRNLTIPGLSAIAW